MPNDARGYRSCVGIAVFNREGRVFVGRRRAGATTRASAMPGRCRRAGSIEGETPLEAGTRELYEETNIRSVSLLGEVPDWLSYDIPTPLAGLAWKGRYKGQTQKWFAFRFTGEDSEIDVDAPGGGRHKPEFGEWRWERLERVPELIVPFKRDVYETGGAKFSRHSPSSGRARRGPGRGSRA